MHSKFAALALIVLSAITLRAQDDVAMRAMKDELARSVTQLQLEKMEKPYFLSYRMDDIEQFSVSAMLGSLTQEQPVTMRYVTVEVRVGDYAMDNTNYVSMRNFGPGGMFSGINQAPLDDNYQEIRRAFWLATDAQYKKALEDLSAKRATLGARKSSENISDFSKEAPNTLAQQPEKTQVTIDELKTLARDISAVFRDTPDISTSSVEFEYRNDYVRYINSEGSTFTRAQPMLTLHVTAGTQAQDGFPISDTIELFGRSLASLPAKDVLIQRTRAMAARILKLRASESVERYNGPVLFEDEAAAQLFADEFAGGLTAVRTPLSDDPEFEMFFNQLLSQIGGSSFGDKIGGRVMPDFLDVSDQPLLSDYKGTPLLGSNKIDDDGVSTRETKLVEHGILKTLLSTRVPVRAISRSSGSRRSWGPAPTNLLVTSDKTETRDALRKELLRRAKDRGLEYGVVVRRIGAGGSNVLMKMAARFGQKQEAGTSSLAEVYKVYDDGREEILRGMDIGEMSPSAFRDIVAVGDTPYVFNEGFIPRIGALFSNSITASPDLPVVSYVVPSMLFEELSLTKSRGSLPNLPVSPSPLAKQ